MKIYDIVNEAPVSALDRAKQSIAGTVSSGQKRKGEVSKEANQVAKELKSLLQGANVNLNEIPVKTFVDFMKRKGYNDNIEQQVEKFVDSNDPDATLNKKQAENVLLAQVRSASLDSDTSKGKFAGGDNSQTKDKSSAAQGAKDFVSGFKQGWKGDKKTKRSTKKSTAKKPTQTKKSPRDFDKIKNQIDNLSDKQKQDLLKQLEK
jgi:ribosomal protein L12E/L44/L45/RPP1/RPP2